MDTFFQSLTTEIVKFWKSFIGNLPEWIATLSLAGASAAISIFIQPRPRIAFFENFNERYPYSGETLSIPIVGIVFIIIPCIILGLLAIFHTKKIDLGIAVMSLAQTLCFTLLITEALKVTVARPRPNFFSYCKYDEQSKKCTGSKSHKRDARLSFPSGHASISFSSATWLSLFLDNYIPKTGELWWILIRFLPIIFAICIASTRITDYMHHVSDVISGVVLGIGVGVFFFKAQFSRIFANTWKKEIDDNFNAYAEL